MERRNFFKAAAFSAAAATPVLGSAISNSGERAEVCDVNKDCEKVCCNPELDKVCAVSGDVDWELQRYSNNHIRIDNSERTRLALKAAVNLGIDRNIVVFDNDSNVGSFTKRLVYSMLEVEYSDTEEYIYHMYIPSESAYTEEFDVFNESFFGVTFTPTKFLNGWRGGEEITKYYEEDLKGSFPCPKNALVVGISPSGPILGAI